MMLGSAPRRPTKTKSLDNLRAFFRLEILNSLKLHMVIMLIVQRRGGYDGRREELFMEPL